MRPVLKPNRRERHNLRREVLSWNDPVRCNKYRELHKDGEWVNGKVLVIEKAMAFIELEYGVIGLLHISKVANELVKHVGDHVNEGEVYKFKLIYDKAGRMGLSLIDP